MSSKIALSSLNYAPLAPQAEVFVEKDTSIEAQTKRRVIMLRAVFGEFIGSFVIVLFKES